MDKILNNSFKSNKNSKLLSFCNAFHHKRNGASSSITPLDTAYVPSKIESCTSESDYFKPSRQTGQRFTMILPPPNITGTLHLGHALTVTIQDVLVRWHKMQGHETLWIPGVDHAGIATQVIVEKKLIKEQGLARQDIGRYKFEQEVWKWKQEKDSIIENQLKSLGASLDWSRKMFTMDAKHSEAVIEAFIELYDRGFIFRGDYLVNWSCSLQSAISDIEVEHVEVSGRTKVPVPGYDKDVEFGQLYNFAYKLTDSDEEIVVSTTRPETMLGDVAVAVNPNDNRYSSYINKKVWHPFRKECLPVISDEFVDPEFGTGAVKITPSHDHSDFDVGKRHNLPTVEVINKKGDLTENCGQFSGKRRFDARIDVLNELTKLGLLKGLKDHQMVIPICSRSKDVIEYLGMPQWFVRCKEMGVEAIKDVENGRLKIEPKEFEKVWFGWLEGVRDWCISRQLWWGHQIPAYQCHLKNKIEDTRWVVGRNEDEVKKKAAKLFSASNFDDLVIKQDEDVLDTWFSSALLPFSSFGWPQQTGDLEKSYPLSLMETGHDILFFWVARMVMLGKELTRKLPFEKILLHGVICDSFGRKMSKSLGNVVAPEEVISGATLKEMEVKLMVNFESGILSKEELQKALVGQKKMFPNGIPECGSDALRFTLCCHNTKSHLINFDVQECFTNKLFCNKIWQATKFADIWMRKVQEVQKLRGFRIHELNKMDQWILSKLSHLVQLVNDGLSNGDLYISTFSLKNFLYFEFCDVYLEVVKRGLRNSDSKEAVMHCWTLMHCLDTSLTCLAPFMPKLAKHLHERLPHHPETPKLDGFPKDYAYRNVDLENDFGKVMEVIVALRRVKRIFNVTGKLKPKACVVTDEQFYKSFKQVIQDLAACHTFYVESQLPGEFSEAFSDSVGHSVKIYLVIPQEVKDNFTVDFEKLEKREDKILADIEKIRALISSEKLKSSSTLSSKEAELKKIATLEEKLARIQFIKRFADVVRKNKISQ